jgi:hypothetical protein
MRLKFSMLRMLASMNRRKRKADQRAMRAAWGKGPRPRHRRENIALLDWSTHENRRRL